MPLAAWSAEVRKKIHTHTHIHSRAANMAYKTHPSGLADLAVTCDLISAGCGPLVISRETTGLYVTDFPLNRDPAVTE